MRTAILSTFPEEPTRGFSWSLAALVGSVALHFGMLAMLSRRHADPPPPPRPVEVEVIERVKPAPPPPAPAPAPEPPKAAPRVVRLPRHIVPTPPIPAPQPATTPPPPNTEAKPTPPAPVAIGLSLSSTSQSGGFAAPVGNTLYGKPADHAPTPEKVRPYGVPEGQHFVPGYQVTEPPSVVDEIKPPYPEAARKEGLEGQVTLRLTVDAGGRVVNVKLLKGAGHGFDEAALAAAPKLRFRPARVNGEAVATEIPYVMTFLLD